MVLLACTPAPARLAAPGAPGSAGSARPSVGTPTDPGPTSDDAGTSSGDGASVPGQAAEFAEDDPVFSPVCRDFVPPARPPEAPVARCGGAARDALTNARDEAARKKISAALFDYFLSLDFDLHFRMLLDVSRTCGRRCSAQTYALIWMYVGTFYGSAFGQAHEARCAFEAALAWDPAVALDLELATDKTRSAFDAARSARCGS